MQRNNIIQCGSQIYRVLDLRNSNSEIFIIDCIKRTIPAWVHSSAFCDLPVISELQLRECLSVTLPDIESLDAKSQAVINERYTMISDILPVVSNFKKRNHEIYAASTKYKVSRQTIINYLCLYLTFQDKAALAPKRYTSEDSLTADEKNMRWALNKYFYTQKRNSLKTAYTFMLKEKYCDASGSLLPVYPTFNQFRYFYRKHRNLQNYYISRNGIKDYQRNHRPLLGDGVQQFASHVGIGMFDATICDIYLINDGGNLVGRPILTACIDGYSSLCCGYSLSWEGGVYSLRGLLLNIITNKKAWCERFGIIISQSDWNCESLPAVMVTDMGAEYISQTIEQIAELGAKIENLPSFRPELKGSIEKFFDMIQDSFKPYLKGKGVIEPDFRERGAHDYRKDACLTLRDFEKVIIRCIVYYNTQRVIENYPYSSDMISTDVQPYANCIFEYGKNQIGANLISVSKQRLIFTLLPRTTGRFSRNGLKVNGMRYKHEDYTERYLTGGEAVVAYNPDDVSFVWLIDNGEFIQFELIESRFKDKSLSDADSLRDSQKAVVQQAQKANVQAKIDLASHILTIAGNAVKHDDVDIDGVRTARQKERERLHQDYMKGDSDD